MWSAQCRGPGSRPGPGRSRRTSCSSSPWTPVLLVVAVVVLVEAAAAASTTTSAPDADAEKTVPASPPCTKRTSEVLGPKLKPEDNGSLRNKDGQIYPAGTWYATATETRGCPCMVGTCFFKCCPKGQVMYWDRVLRKRRCAFPEELKKAKEAVNATTDSRTARAAPDVNATLVLDLYAPDVNATLVLDLYSASNLEEPAQAGVPPPGRWIVMYNTPIKKGMRLEPWKNEDDTFYLLANGSLLVPGHYPGTPLLPSEFCMDVFEDNGLVSALVPFPAVDVDTVTGMPLPDFVNILGLLISLPFLMLTFLVYATIGELQNLHGKSLMCHVGAMTLAFMDLLLVKFGIGSNHTPVCKFLGFFLQFTFLACFFWLNIMCFDIWWTFSGFRSVHGSPSWSSSGERLRFRLYSVYAWGAPLLILAVTVLVQEVGDMLDGGLPWYVIHPGVGVYTCYLGAAVAKYAYFTGPMAVLLLCNVVLFLHTAIRIVQLRRETRALKGAESRRHTDERNRYIVYLKLFITMGGYWTAELLSGVLPESDYLWIITDVPNSLQGILIFIMCVGTGHVRTLVLNRVFHRRAARTVSSVSSTRTTNTRANGTNTRANGTNSSDHGGSIKMDLVLQQVKTGPTPCEVVKGPANDGVLDDGVLDAGVSEDGALQQVKTVPVACVDRSGVHGNLNGGPATKEPF